MTLQVPDQVAAQAGCGSAELLFGMLAGLYLEGRLTLGQAAASFGISKPEMLRALDERGLPVAYTAEDATRDVATIERLWPR